MNNTKLWGGRFSKPTAKIVEEFNASIQFDCELAHEDILGSLAHADMLSHCNIISAADHQQIKQGLQHIAKNLAEDKIHFRLADEDIHMNIERLLIEEIGDAAGKLHTARSRNDQVALDLHLYLRKKITQLMRNLLNLQNTLIAIAKQNEDVIMPGYTHLQRAQPIYFAQHLQAYIAMLERDFARLKMCWQNTNISPLGACALAGTTFNTDPLYTAKILKFDGIYHNTLDAVADRDFVIEFLAAASISMMHLSRVCEELIIWSSLEFNFISFDDAYSTGSSIMPQKKNPDIAELARGKVGRVYGSLLSLLTTLKGLPLAYNKDLQEDKEPLFDTIKTWQLTLIVLEPLFRTLKVNKNNMALATKNGYLNATAFAEYLVKKGYHFRLAHEMVGKMVAYCIEKQCQLEDLTLDEMQKFAIHIDENVKDALQIESITKTCGQKNCQETFKEYAEIIAMNHLWLQSKEELLASLYEQFNLP